MEFIGKELGSMALIAYIGTLLNYVAKKYHKNWKKIFKTKANDKDFQESDALIMKIFVHNHMYWGLAAGVLLIAHGILQIIQYGLVWSGALTAVVMLGQIILGLKMTKSPSKKILKAHKFIAALLLVFLATHLIHIKFFL